MSVARGAIHSEDRARQLHDFSGLSIGTITPTDLDGLIDYHGESFAFFEIKKVGASMPRGQEIALLRVVNLIAMAGKRSVLFEVEHDEINPSRTVDASRCIVRRTYFKGVWRDRRDTGLTLRQAVDRFLNLEPVTPEPQPAVVVHQPIFSEPVECPTAEEIFGKDCR